MARLSFMPQIHRYSERSENFPTMAQLRLRYFRTFIDEEPPAEAMARRKSLPALGRPAVEEEACGFMNSCLLTSVFQNAFV